MKYQEELIKNKQVNHIRAIGITILKYSFSISQTCMPKFNIKLFKIF